MDHSKNYSLFRFDSQGQVSYKGRCATKLRTRYTVVGCCFEMFHPKCYWTGWHWFDGWAACWRSQDTHRSTSIWNIICSRHQNHVSHESSNPIKRFVSISNDVISMPWVPPARVWPVDTGQSTTVTRPLGYYSSNRPTAARCWLETGMIFFTLDHGRTLLWMISSRTRISSISSFLSHVRITWCTCGLALRVWTFLIPGEEMLQTTHNYFALHILQRIIPSRKLLERSIPY